MMTDDELRAIRLGETKTEAKARICRHFGGDAEAVEPERWDKQLNLAASAINFLYSVVEPTLTDEQKTQAWSFLGPWVHVAAIRSASAAIEADIATMSRGDLDLYRPANDPRWPSA